VLLDPFVSAVKPGKNSHNNAETRQGLQHVVDFAERRNCAVLGVHHLTKGTKGNDPVERLTGSLAMGAIPRIVMMTVKNRPGEEPPRLLVRAASNIGPSGGGFGYDIEERFVPDADGVDISATRIKWGDYISGDAKALVDAAEMTEEPEEKKRPAVGKAKAFLNRLLKDGPRRAADVYSEALAEGHAERTIKRAKNELGILSVKNGDGVWEWSLPFEEPPPTG
jgi:hypothetical protein